MTVVPTENDAAEVAVSSTALQLLDEIKETLEGAPFVVINGQTHYVRTISQCDTCQSPHRFFIERQVLRRQSYASIARAVADMSDGTLLDKKPPSDVSIAQHFNRQHSNFRALAYHRLMAAEAQLQGVDQAVDDILVTPRLVNNVVLNEGLRMIEEGQIKVSGQMLMQAVGNGMKQEEIDQTTAVDKDFFAQAIQRYFEVLGDVAPEAMEKVGRALESDPVLTMMIAQAQGRPVPQQVKGEVMEPPSQD